MSTSGDRRVLVIDDSEAIHKLLRARLRPEGIQLLGELSGAQGLVRARAEIPELILLDTSLPDMHGFDVCRELRADAKTRDIPIIFISGASRSESKVEGLDLGASDYITKPFDQNELRARVRAALRLTSLQHGLTIEFRRAVWGQLVPIEIALSATIGDRYSVRKHSNRIAIEFDSVDALQTALDACLPVLAGLEAEAPGEIDKVTWARSGESASLQGTDCRELLEYLVGRFDEVNPPGVRTLTSGGQSVVALTRGIPWLGDLLGLWADRWMRQEASTSSTIYRRFRTLFRSTDQVLKLASPTVEELARNSTAPE